MQFELLEKHHDRTAFDCGNDEINCYVHTKANQHHKKGFARVHILAENKTIIGFYTLTSISLEMPLKGFPNTIPAMLIGRMGVDRNYQGQGFSKLLLSHALQNIKQMSITAGIMLAVIDAKDENLAEYYTKFGFKQTTKPLRLVFNMDSI